MVREQRASRWRPDIMNKIFSAYYRLSMSSHLNVLHLLAMPLPASCLQPMMPISVYTACPLMSALRYIYSLGDSLRTACLVYLRFSLFCFLPTCAVLNSLGCTRLCLVFAYYLRRRRHNFPRTLYCNASYYAHYWLLN